MLLAANIAGCAGSVGDVEVLALVAEKDVKNGALAVVSKAVVVGD